MSAEEPGPSAVSRRTKPPALGPQVWDEDEEEDEKEIQGGQQHKSRSSSGESEEESEPELPLIYTTRRKVSFADAFGLDLVSVKEFDIGAGPGSSGPAGLLGAAPQDGACYRLSRLFAVPSSDEELVTRLRQNKLEVESVEFLPDTTTIRGVVRVLNLSYHKAVYVRTTLDGWGSHFDLLADYMPGSSDGETDCFSFRFALMPPFLAEGARVEFCLRYESSNGTFWANNGGANYVLSCHCGGKRDQREKEGEKEKETEDNNHKGKKSCLKAVRKWNCAESKSTDMSVKPSEPESLRPADSEGKKTQCETKRCPSEAPEESHKVLAERRSRRRAARLAHIQKHFSLKHRETQLDHASHSESTEAALNGALPAPPVRPDTSNEIQVSGDREQNGDTAAPVRIGHQSAVLSLGKRATSPACPHVSEISSSSVVCEEQIREDGSAVSCADAWEAFLNGTDRPDAPAPDQEGSGYAGPFPLHVEHEPPAPGDEVLAGWGATGDAQESLMTGCQAGSFGAEGSLESDPTTEWSDTSEHARNGVLDYECAAEPALVSERSTGRESEPAPEQQGRVGGTAAVVPPDGQLCRETSFGEDGSLLATDPARTFRTEDTTGPGNSKAEGGVSPEVGKKDNVKREAHGAAGDDLTFAGVRDMLFPDGHAKGGGAFARQHTEKEREPDQEKEPISEENDNTAPAKEKTQSEQSEVLAEELERRRLAENKEPTASRGQTTETLVFSVSEGGVFNKEELDTQTECLDLEAFEPQGEEAATHLDPLKERLADTSEKQRPQAASVVTVAADWNCESSNTKAESQGESCVGAEVTHGRESGGKLCTDSLLGEGPYRTITMDTHEPVTSHTPSSPSGSCGWTESAGESGSLLLPASDQFFECSVETLKRRATQDRQEPDGEGEYPAPSPRTTAPSLGKILLVFCSLGFVSRALVYAILVMIVITAYLHDLPICLALYLLSVCWWCGQGMKKQEDTADSVD